MSDEDRNRPLPQRERGATRAGTAPAPVPAMSPVLTEELRQRMKAAVNAERAQALDQARDRGAEMLRHPPRSKNASGDAAGPADRDVASPADKGANGKRKRADKPERHARPESAVKQERRIKPERLVNSAHPVAAEAWATTAPEVNPEPWVTTAPEVRPQPEVPLAPEAVSSEPPVTRAAAVQRQPVSPAPANRPPTAAQAAAGRPAQSALRPAGPAKGRGRRRLVTASLVVLALAVVAAASVGTVLFMHKPSAPSSSGSSSTAGPSQEAAAAAWVFQEVDHNAIVSCDRAMCAMLVAAGFPMPKLRVLEAGSPPDNLKASEVVVDTAAARNLFGTSLSTASAPDVLTTFGSGKAAISVRVIATGGAAAYQKKLSADLAVRKADGAALLLQGNNITVSAVARSQLVAGQVDSRLLEAIANLAASQAISIVRFGNTGSGASPDVPLRVADLATNDPAGHLASSAYVQALRVHLSTGPGSLPASTKPAVLPAGQRVLQIEFPAPSPLGQPGLK